MNKLMNFLSRFKEKRGITGADVAAAITVIVLTVGIATAIYVNSVNKSRDNMRYAAAVRIATSIIENIQSKPYQYLVNTCNQTIDGVANSFSKKNGEKAFDTKIPNGFSATIISKPATSSSLDIARDVIVNVKYKTSSTYKTLTLNTIKEKELLDMTNTPDLSLIPDYNPNDTTKFYYPVKQDSAKSGYVVTTYEDVEWYDYSIGNYAIIACSETTLNVGGSDSSWKLYVWIPRFVAKDTGNDIQYLYGSSSYKIIWLTDGDLGRYGLSIGANNLPTNYDGGYKYLTNTFEENDGKTGYWYSITGTNDEKVKASAVALNKRNSAKNITLPTI